MAHRLCLRHELLLRRRICGVRRAVRLAVRARVHLDRPRQRRARVAPCLGGVGEKDARHVAAPSKLHDERLLRQALFEPCLKNSLRCHHLHLFDSVHRVALQRPFPPLCDGIPHRLLDLHRHHGGADGRLRRCGRLHGDGGQRLHSGHHHARGHRRGHCGCHRERRRLGANFNRPLPRLRPFGLRPGGRVYVLLRPRYPLALVCRRLDVARHLGAPADGAEVLRHQG